MKKVKKKIRRKKKKMITKNDENFRKINKIIIYLLFIKYLFKI